MVKALEIALLVLAVFMTIYSAGVEDEDRMRVSAFLAVALFALDIFAASLFA